MIKNIAIIIGILGTLSAGFISYGQVTERVDNNREEIAKTAEEVREKMEDSRKQLIEIQLRNAEQQVINQGLLKAIDRLHERIDP